MAVVACRLLQEGHTVEETAQMIRYPVSYVEEWKKGME